MKKKVMMGILIGLAAGVCNGLFGAGGGMIVVPALEKFGCLEPKQAHATSVAIIGAICVVSAFFYLQGGAVKFSDAYPYIFGGIIGGFAGGKLLSKISNTLLSRLFGGFMVYAALRILIVG